MADLREFKGFFSYAHHDAQTDAGLIAAFTKELERRVTAKLVNAKFLIWQDKDQLRSRGSLGPDDRGGIAGRRRADCIADATVDRLGLLPEGIHDIRGCGGIPRSTGYVAPILARPIEQQERCLTSEQQDIFIRIRQRQYFEADAAGFLKLSKAQRNVRIDKIADDIAGMIQRFRHLAAGARPIGRRPAP